MQTIQDVWDGIMQWASKCAPKLKASIRPGATTIEIGEAESELGVEFPADVVQSYLLHDGQEVDNYDGSVVSFIEGCELLSLRRMIQQWSGWKESQDRGDFLEIASSPEPPVKADWWNVKWIPVTSNGFGDNACMDLDPAMTGSRGQIIQVWHDQSSRPVLAQSFASWLQQFLQELHSGDYVFSDEHGGLVRMQDLGPEE